METYIKQINLPIHVKYTYHKASPGSRKDGRLIEPDEPERIEVEEKAIVMIDSKNISSPNPINVFLSEQQMEDFEKEIMNEINRRPDE